MPRESGIVEMPSGFTFELKPSFRDLRGRFAVANEDLLEGRRELLRVEAQRYVELAGEEAPGGAGHTVANQIGYETFNEGDVLGFRTRLGQIASWQSIGTGLYGPLGQVIRPRTARALHFFIDGEEFFRAWVRGVRPNAYLGRAYRRWFAGAGENLRKIALRYSRTLASGTKGGTL